MGFGWGGFYISGPIALSNNLNEKNRAVYFSYLAAWNAMGSGLSPIVFNWLSSMNLSTHTLFKTSIIPCILAMCCFLYAKRYDNALPIVNKKREKLSTVIFNREFFRSKAIYPIVMVLIGACLFSSMMNFQVSYAKINHLNYSWYFFFYTLVVIVSRFTLSKAIAKISHAIILPSLVFIMIAAMIIFMFIGYGLVIYIISAILFGLSYGLIYPLIKAIAVNVISNKLHDVSLTYFTLSYFIGVYVFPFINGFMLTYTSYHFVIYMLIFVAILYQITVFLFLKSTNRSHEFEAM